MLQSTQPQKATTGLGVSVHMHQVVFNLAEHAKRGVQVMRVFFFFNGNGTVRNGSGAAAQSRSPQSLELLACLLRTGP